MSSFSFPSRRICSETVYVGARLDEKRKKKKNEKKETDDTHDGASERHYRDVPHRCIEKKGLRGRGAEAR